MSILRIALTVAVAAGISAAAAAQTPASPDAATPPTVSGPVNPAAPVDQSTSAPPAAAPNMPMAMNLDVNPIEGATSTYTVGADGVRTQHIASLPVPDTTANRAKYGPPMSHAGRRTPPAGN